VGDPTTFTIAIVSRFPFRLTAKRRYAFGGDPNTCLCTGSDHTALRGPRRSFPTAARGFPFSSRSRPEPSTHLDQTQHVPIDQSSAEHTLHESECGNGVKVLGQIGVDHIGVAFTE